jgi:hypothetical protein
MAIEGLESALLKFEHAGRHLEALTETVDAYANSGRFKIKVSWTPNPPEYVLHGEVTDAIPVPDLISLQAADLVGNLRAALDHSVFDHVVKEGISRGLPLTAKQEKAVKFPILEKEAAIDSPGWYAPAVLAVLEKHQPFHQSPAHDHPLARLNRLVNHDKHRVALVTSAAELLQEIEYTGPLEHVSSEDALDGVEVKPGLKIMRVKFQAREPLKKHPQEYITNMEFGFFASIDIPGANQSPHILPTLREIRDYVQTVLDDLKEAGVK